MTRKANLLKLVKFSTIIAGIVILSACSSSSLFGSNNDSKTDNMALANADIDQETLAQNSMTALPAIATECPAIKVRNGGEAIFSYANNKIGDARALRYQAVIDKQSRNCVVSNGLITIKMGVVGRVLLGPMGNVKQVNLPLRFVVERDEVAVFSQKYDIPINITPPNQSEEFIKVVENVAVPYIGGENIVIWVGFDTSSG